MLRPAVRPPSPSLCLLRFSLHQPVSEQISESALSGAGLSLPLSLFLHLSRSLSLLQYALTLVSHFSFFVPSFVLVLCIWLFQFCPSGLWSSCLSIHPVSLGNRHHYKVSLVWRVKSRSVLQKFDFATLVLIWCLLKRVQTVQSASCWRFCSFAAS